MSRCFEGSSSAAGFLVHFNEWRCSEYLILQTNSKALLVFWEVFWLFLGVFQVFGGVSGCSGVPENFTCWL